MDPLQKEKHYTYSDYLTWDDNKRYELIDGVVYMMSSPTQIHQEISMELSFQLTGFLKGKSCKVFHAPFDVRLNANDRDDSVCQPDIIVVCDQSKLDGKCCKGSPDFIIEILSPSSTRYDRVLKFNRYLQAGVREYWIIDPADKTLTTHLLEGDKYIANAYTDTDIVPVHVLEGCSIHLPDVFQY